METPTINQLPSNIEVTWVPQPGSQVAFLFSPVFETLIEGTRGGGKTDALIMDFAQHCGQGYGAEWRGILFRQTYKQLQDIVGKTKKWFPRMYPGVVYNKVEHIWTWPDGEELLLRYMRVSDDYDNYHGHAYPWIGWEELTNWPSPDCYTVMMSCSRSTVKDMPRKYRATCNPYGVGHSWVKKRFRLPIIRSLAGPIITDSHTSDGMLEPHRVSIHSALDENKLLLAAEPDYLMKVSAAARNESERKAWVEGSWDIIAGGMFNDLWAPAFHVLPNFPFELIPAGWRIDRSYDHGQSAPFSVGWWAQSNGEAIEWEGKRHGTIRGDLIRIAEWYGWNGNDNQGVRMLSTKIARGILDREEDWGIKGRVKPGPADTNIFDDYEPNKSVAGDMKSIGVRWVKADKGPGSRKQGWEQIRKLLLQALPVKGNIREEPGLFITDRCQQFIRTVVNLPRDDKDLDDVDTLAEDHIGDETRYRVRKKKGATTSVSSFGGKIIATTDERVVKI